MAARRLPDGVGGERTPDEADLPANLVTIHQRLETALTSNATYLALGSPTALQNTTQIQRLTREVNGLIRLILGGKLGDVSDTA